MCLRLQCLKDGRRSPEDGDGDRFEPQLRAAIKTCQVVQFKGLLGDSYPMTFSGLTTEGAGEDGSKCGGVPGRSGLRRAPTPRAPGQPRLAPRPLPLPPQPPDAKLSQRSRLCQPQVNPWDRSKNRQRRNALFSFQAEVRAAFDPKRNCSDLERNSLAECLREASDSASTSCPNPLTELLDQMEAKSAFCTRVTACQQEQ